MVRDGILYRDFVHADGSRKWLQVIVPAALRMELVRVAHDCPTGGHFGQRRTADQVQRRAYWPSWRQAVERCCRECEVCARVHRGRPPRQGPLQPLDVNGPMDRLHIDLCGPFPRSDGKVYILTCVDAFTRYLTATALPNKEATTVAEALVRHTFCLLGLPRQILTDLGSEFQNHIMQEVLQTMHVTQLKTTSFHPACNGRGERVHRTLNALMSKLVADNQKDWARLLPQCTFAYNVSRSDLPT